MNFVSKVSVSILALSSACYGALLGDTVNFATSATGTTTVSAPTVLSATVGAGGEVAFCVGSPGVNCPNSGFTPIVDISDSAIAFQFFGSTTSATGSFTFVISGIDAPVLGVSLTSGSLSAGSFVVSSFDASSITFTGTPGPSFDGSNMVFAVDQGAAAPEPASVVLVSFGVAVLGWQARRRACRAPRQ